jgi:hypothetical protein
MEVPYSSLIPKNGKPLKGSDFGGEKKIETFKSMPS